MLGIEIRSCHIGQENQEILIRRETIMNDNSHLRNYDLFLEKR